MRRHVRSKSQVALLLMAMMLWLLACSETAIPVRESEASPTLQTTAALAVEVTPSASTMTVVSATPILTLTPTPSPQRLQPTVEVSPSPSVTLVDSPQPQILNEITLPLTRDRPGAVLLDPATRRLYILEQQGGTLHVFNVDTDEVITSLETLPADAPPQYADADWLALDPAGNRLFISGQPVRVVDTVAFTVTPLAQLNGHVAFDTAHTRLFYTPQCTCRVEVCNTRILDAETFTSSATLFPPDQPPLTAHCVYKTTYNAPTRQLYTHINNGVSGSNNGNHFALFDVAGEPALIYEDRRVSFASPVWYDDSLLVSRFGRNEGSLHQFDIAGRPVAEVQQRLGVAGRLQVDAQTGYLYVAYFGELLVFDPTLTLRAHIDLPGDVPLLTLDSVAQKLYFGTRTGLLVLSTRGGQPAVAQADPLLGSSSFTPFLVLAADGTWFRSDERGMFASSDEGQSWLPRSQGLPSRFIRHIAASPNFAVDQTLWAAPINLGYTGGLYRSIDGGRSWVPSTRGLDDLSIGGIYPSPTFAADATVFVDTRNRGLYRSIDGGQTWTSIASGYAGSNQARGVLGMALSPSFAADGVMLINYDTIWRSNDGGDRWQNTGVPGGQLAFSPQVPGLVLSSSGWRSEDAGQSWDPAAAGWPASPFSRQDVFFDASGTAYLTFQPDYEAPRSLQRSLDGGQTWQTLLDVPPLVWQAAHPLHNDELLLVGRDTVLPSQAELVVWQPDAARWGQTPPDLSRPDAQALAVIGGDATELPRLFAASNEVGVLRSVDGGADWQQTTFPARSDSVEPALLAQTEDGRLFTALGAAFYRSDDEGRTWQAGGELTLPFAARSLHRTPDGRLLLGGNYLDGRILESGDDGQTWATALSPDETASADVVALASNGERDLAWLQYNGLWSRQSGTNTWTRLQADDQTYVQTMVFAPDGRLWIGALDGQVLVSDDGGQTLLDIGGRLPTQRTWSSAFAFPAADTVLLGTDQGIWRSTDAGQTWQTANTGLPRAAFNDLPPGVRTLLVQGGMVYAGLTEQGVFLSGDGGRTWHGTLAEARAAVAASPEPTPPPEPTPIPAGDDCLNPPQYFRNVNTAELGCPVDERDAQVITVAEQFFEGGIMFWRSDKAEIYVLFGDGTFSTYLDLWNDTLPVYSCPDEALSETPPTPQRGFGLVWCGDPQVRQALGPALTEERAYEAVLQDFDQGTVLETDLAEIYRFNLARGSWFQN